MIHNTTKIGALFMAGVLACTLHVNSANAQGVSLSVYPPVVEVEATPPSSPVVPIILTNNNDTDITLQIQLVPFKTNNVNGDIQLMPHLMDQGFYPYYRDRIQFLEADKKTNEITLQGLESKEIMLNVNLSKGDPPGDYYYSIIFISQGNSPQETSASQLPAGIATNLLLSIGPKGKAAGGISQFSTSTLRARGPVEFSLKVHNASKHLVIPAGSVTITNIFGQKVGIVDILPQYILAGGDRFLLDKHASTAAITNNELIDNPKIIWNEGFLFGLYRAEAKIALEERGTVLTASTYFIAFPVYFFIPIVVVLFIAFSIYLRVKKKI